MIITFEQHCIYPTQNKYLLLANLLSVFERVSVEFTKKDGTFRSMVVTRSDKYLPATDVTINHTTKTIDFSTFSAWSIEDAGWRSFKTDSVISIATHNNE